MAPKLSPPSPNLITKPGNHARHLHRESDATHDHLHIKQKRSLRPHGQFGIATRVVPAQDEFRRFLRDLVSPAMRTAG